jgi:ABC-type uncharacterized transport system permease subunit
MILSTGGVTPAVTVTLALAALAVAAYGLAGFAPPAWRRLSALALGIAAATHLVLLALDIGGFGAAERGARFGFGPVVSLTVWLVLAVHAVESRMLPLPAVRRTLAVFGALAVVMAAAFPGDVRQFASPWTPLHLVLGIGAYGLLGAAVLHALMLDAAERRMRSGVPTFGVPLLQLERLTFRFVEAGFVVLSAAVLLGAATMPHWRWDHKTVFSVLGWAVFALLLVGRHLRGWRGRRATGWLYAGALLLLLAYVGSRFVMEVVLERPAP